MELGLWEPPPPPRHPRGCQEGEGAFASPCAPGEGGWVFGGSCISTTLSCPRAPKCCGGGGRSAGALGAGGCLAAWLRVCAWGVPAGDDLGPSVQPHLCRGQTGRGGGGQCSSVAPLGVPHIRQGPQGKLGEMLRVEVIKGGLGGSAGTGDPAEDAILSLQAPWCWVVLVGGGGTCTPNVAHWSFAQRPPSAPRGLVPAGHPVAPSRLGLAPPELVLALGMLLPSSTAGGSSPPPAPPQQGGRSTGRLLVGMGWRLEHPFPRSSSTVRAECHGWGKRGPLGGGHLDAALSPCWAPNVPDRDVAQWGN